MPVTRITQLQIAVCVMTSIRRFVAAGHVRSLNRGRAELILCLQRIANFVPLFPSYSFPLLFNRTRSIFATGSINKMKFVHNCSFDKNCTTRSWNKFVEEKNNTRIYDKLQLTRFIRYNSRNEEGGKNRKHNQICLMQASSINYLAFQKFRLDDCRAFQHAARRGARAERIIQAWPEGRGEVATRAVHSFRPSELF